MGWGWLIHWSGRFDVLTNLIYYYISYPGFKDGKHRKTTSGTRFEAEQLRGHQQRLQQEISRIEQSLRQLRSQSSVSIANPGISETKLVVESAPELQSKPEASKPLPPGMTIFLLKFVCSGVGS